MAWLSMNFKSKTLNRPVELEVLMPQSGKADKVLFLLHGAVDNRNAWLLKSQIEVFAEGKDLCVVMPDGMNSFYVNTKNSYKFMDFICDELPGFIRKMFHVPEERNDWMIAGNSMGGYGAIRCGVQVKDVFGYVASFSGALDVVDLYENCDFTNSFANVWNVFGDKDDLVQSDNNLYVLMAKNSKECELTKFLLTCGWDDDLAECNRRFSDEFGEDYDMVYIEKRGGHDWAFWNDSLRCAIEWFYGNPDFEEVL